MRSLLLTLATLAGASAYLRHQANEPAVLSATDNEQSRFVQSSESEFSASSVTALSNVMEVDMTIISQNMANTQVAFPWSRQHSKMLESGIDCTSSKVIVVATQENSETPINYVNGVFQACPMKTAAGAVAAVPQADTPLEYFTDKGAPLTPAPKINAHTVVIKHAATGSLWTRRIVKTDIGFQNIKQTAFKQYLVVFAKWEGQTTPPKYEVKESFFVYLQKKWGMTFKTKAVLSALVTATEGGVNRSFIVASGHLPMKGDDDAEHGYGMDKRIGAWKVYMSALAAQSWYKPELPIIWTGDSNFRVDNVNGDQLEKILADNKPDSPFAGWNEPALPRGYTCRYQTAAYMKLEADAAKQKAMSDTLDLCRSGVTAEWSMDWSHSASPWSKYSDYGALIDHKDKKTRAALVGEKDPHQCVPAVHAGIAAVLTAAASERDAEKVRVAKNKAFTAKVFCGCGSLDKVRPLGFCDRVIYKHAADAKIRYNAYESVYLHDGSDHNAIIANLKMLIATNAGAFDDAANVAALKALETTLATAQASSGSLAAQGHVNLIPVPAVASPGFGANVRRPDPVAAAAAVGAAVAEAEVVAGAVRAVVPAADGAARFQPALKSIDDEAAPIAGGNEADNIDTDEILTPQERTAGRSQTI